MLSSMEILDIICGAIEDWHSKCKARPENYVIVTDEIRRIRPHGQHRADMSVVIRELAETNTEMWHEEDKVRSLHDDVVLKAIRNINPLNQHRNDLIEEIDEIMVDKTSERQHLGL